MERQFYIDLAARKLAMPIGSDLVLHESDDPEAVRLDGKRLGPVLVKAARRYRTPLAFPLMDLQIEKEDLLLMLGVEPSDIETFHFDEDGIEEADLKGVLGKLSSKPPTARMVAAMEAIRHVASEGDLVPMGMAIGPFSLLAKLLEDPITTVYLASNAEEGDDELEVVERMLELCTDVIERWIRLQMEAGAKAICLCEPAANATYISPRQLEVDPEIFDRFVIRYNKRLSDCMSAADVDLVFHDCGELLPVMIRKFEQLNPAILSLGSPVPLWEAVPHTHPRTVLFGNLPSKKFYSDKEFPEAVLKKAAAEIRAKMDATGHPYILGSECDVLCVKGHESAIRHKTDLLLDC